MVFVWHGGSSTYGQPPTSLQQHRNKRTMEAMRSMGIQTADVNPKGTIDMLFNQLTNLVQTKGDTGIDPDEIEHIPGIKAMLDNTILPTILEEVKEDRLEHEVLYQEIVACHDHLHTSRTKSMIMPKGSISGVCNNRGQTEKDEIYTSCISSAIPFRNNGRSKHTHGR
eukprot:6458172-Amphidinium_carterae.2